jgi:CHAT domain-containing protein
MGKAEALQQAQLTLLNTTDAAAGSNRTGDATVTVIDTRTGLPVSITENPEHPYYWAPFILIGNGL